MRIYYVMEIRGRRCHVLSALGVDDRAWNRLYRRVREWRRHLELRHGIPGDGELRASGSQTTAAPSEPHCACDCHAQTDSPQMADVVGQGLRVVEDLAVETGGVQVINVCLDTGVVPANRRVALDRLFNRINATAAHYGDHALLIFGWEPDETVIRTYERLRSHNPVPVRVGASDDGWHTRNLPIDRIIGGPVFRSPDADCLLHMAGLVAHALVWREEPQNLDGLAGAFDVLDRALNRRASRNDPQGVVRR
ncbi:MAG: hypothetical protein OXR67_14895 [Chloroflexota bacterium]|nr:hypothetical protein [Chloroflexota bacterium]